MGFLLEQSIFVGSSQELSLEWNLRLDYGALEWRLKGVGLYPVDHGRLLKCAEQRMKVAS